MCELHATMPHLCHNDNAKKTWTNKKQKTKKIRKRSSRKSVKCRPRCPNKSNCRRLMSSFGVDFFKGESRNGGRSNKQRILKEESRMVVGLINNLKNDHKIYVRNLSNTYYTKLTIWVYLKEKNFVFKC